MRKKIIPKKTKGEFRTLYCPSKTEKEALKEIFPSILIKALNHCNLDVCQGFFPNTSPVTNALKHIGYKYTTMFDLKDFFDSVNINHLKNKLDDYELSLVLVDGAPRQGLPTSPIVANLAACEMDIDLTPISSEIVYTRYADDLAFSYNDPYYISMLNEFIPKIIENHGFKVNPKKTRTMSSVNGRRIITGIAIDDYIHPTRRTKRKLRAALHRNNKKTYIGLKEWCKLKRPHALTRLEFDQATKEFTEIIFQHTFLP